MKKKISIIACAIVMLMMSVFATGCSCNRKILDWNYNYNRCVVYENGVWTEYRVDSWDDYNDGTITIWTTDGQMIYTHSVNVIMYGEG